MVSTNPASEAVPTDRAIRSASGGPPTCLPTVSEVVQDLGITIASHPIAVDTSASPRLNRYIAATLKVSELVGRRVAWKLLVRAVHPGNRDTHEEQVLLAARHLLGLVEYPRTDRGGFDRHAVIEGDVLSASGLHALRVQQTPFANFDPIRFAGQRRLIAGRVGGWTEQDRTGMVPRPSLDLSRGGRMMS